MGTRGHVTAVMDDCQYGYYQHFDSYPSGWPSDFLRDAAEVAREGSWDSVREDWLETRWLDHEDDENPEIGLLPWAVRETGRMIDTAYEMRPRPGVRSIRDMPAVLKEVMRPEERFNDREYAMVLDFDHNRVVMLKYMGPWSDDELRYPDFRPVPIAQAAMDDPDAMEEIVAWARLGEPAPIAVLDPPPTRELPAAWGGGKPTFVYHEDPRFLFHTSVGGPELVPFDPYDTYDSRVAERLADFPPAAAVRDRASSHTGRDWPVAPRALQDLSLIHI